MSTALPTEAQHGLSAHSHGAGVPVQTRSERFRSRNVSDFASVTGREAEWKLSPVAQFRDLLDDSLDGTALPVETELAEGVTVSTIPLDDSRITRAGLPEDRASANALSSVAEATLVTVSSEDAGTSIVRRVGLGGQARAAHTVIEARPNARGLVVLEGQGAARLSENVEILVGEGADLTVVSLQNWDDEAVHLSSHFARIARDAKLTHIVVSLGGRIVRVNPSSHLAEPGADVESLGLYFSDAGQHLEQQVFVHHDAPHTKSRVTYKGALQGEGARSVWIGDVLIGRDATGTDSYEQNRNLVLTDGTRADSIPNLEIETGDIEGAGHASATGRFDDEQLFYLQARGIEEDEARRLVVRGFLNEIVQRIPDEALQERLGAALEAELQGVRS
ncbi:MAG TPA: Fe-S cluster assembly protein SufD [Microbacteriaceae bacterium]|nr:Fe-S cluster assembly protein SufD [Microbacteriaceae bacterium]